MPNHGFTVQGSPGSMRLSQQHAGTHGADPWLETLRALIREQPEPGTIEEAIAPLARLQDELGQPKIDVAAVQGACNQLIALPEGDWHPSDWRRTHPDFSQKHALAIHIYTRQDPNVYGPLGDALHDTANRASGPGGVSDDVRACLPFVKLLDVALVESAIVFGFFSGQVFRGVKFAFPEPTYAAHDPEAFFPPGRELHWFEFNSSSKEFEVMYREYFCGRSGPRTVFTIKSCEGVSVKPFSQLPDEEEVLFRPLAHFRVTSSQKKLQRDDLGPAPPAEGGFPDDVHLEQLPTFDQMEELVAQAALRTELREAQARERQKHEELQHKHEELAQEQHAHERTRVAASQATDLLQELEQLGARAAHVRSMQLEPEPEPEPPWQGDGGGGAGALGDSLLPGDNLSCCGRVLARCGSCCGRVLARCGCACCERQVSLRCFQCKCWQILAYLSTLMTTLVLWLALPGAFWLLLPLVVGSCTSCFAVRVGSATRARACAAAVITTSVVLLMLYFTIGCGARFYEIALHSGEPCDEHAECGGLTGICTCADWDLRALGSTCCTCLSGYSHSCPSIYYQKLCAGFG